MNNMKNMNNEYQYNEYQYNEYDQYDNGVKIHEAYTYNITNNTMSNNIDNYVVVMMLTIPLFVSTFTCSFYMCQSIYYKIKKKYKAYNINNGLKEKILNEEIEIICSICLEDFQKYDKYIEFECNHIYHKNCIKEWLQNHTNCPNCRKIII